MLVDLSSVSKMVAIADTQDLAKLTPADKDLTSCTFADVASLPHSTFQVALVYSKSPLLLDQLAAILRTLLPGGTINVTIPQPEKELVSALKLSGFTNIQSLSSDSSDVQSTSTATTLTATKPAYEVGTSSKLTFKPTATPASDLIDDSTLLDDEDLAAKPTYDDCEIGSTRKACKDCSCGRAEEEAKEKTLVDKVALLSKIEDGSAGSSCGNVRFGF